MTTSNSGIMGEATIQLFGPTGDLKFEETKHNLITTVGDEYYAKMGAAGIGSVTAPAALADGMKLGSGTADPAKSSTGSSIGTYITGSNNAFTSVAVNAVGGNNGYTIDYVATWAAADATDSAITEAVICTDAESDDIGAAADVIARVEFSAVNKGPADSLVITWKHKFLGAPA